MFFLYILYADLFIPVYHVTDRIDGTQLPKLSDSSSMMVNEV
jgi:hypothetical protein